MQEGQVIQVRIHELGYKISWDMECLCEKSAKEKGCGDWKYVVRTNEKVDEEEWSVAQGDHPREES